MILADLKKHLLSFTDLTSRIGDRVFIQRAPEKAVWPYVILSTVSGDPQYSLQGEVGRTQTIIQVANWDRDPNGPWKASEVAGLIRDKLSHWRGDWGDTFVCDCTLQSEPVEELDEPDDGSDDWYHGVSQDYQVMHAQAVPTLS